MSTIYRKYRPRNFFDVIGQEHIKKTLQNEIEHGQISHAYLFSGPRGTGKTTVARIFAKAINCENRKDSEPCNKCSICEEISANRSFDIIEIDAASNRGIDEIRELRDFVRFTPNHLKYKVFVIDEVHMLTTEAFNALLKTLEEPPSYAVFILATTEIHKVPETIISRCQRFDFVKVPFNQILDRLKIIIKKEGIEVDEEVLKSIVYRSEGCVRDSESLLAQVLSLDSKHITLEEASLVLPKTQLATVLQFISHLLKKDTKSAILFANDLVDGGLDLKQFIFDTIEILRKTLLLKSGINDEKVFWEIDKENQDKLNALIKDVELLDLVNMIKEFIAIQSTSEFSEIPQLPLELAIIKICSK